MAQGRLQEAEQACREALSLDPLFTGVWYNLGRLAAGTGRYKEAEGFFRKGLEFQPKASRFHTHLASVYLLQNNPALALEEARLEPDEFWRAYALSLTQQAPADRAAGDAALEILTAKHAADGAYQIAIVHAVRKEPDEMFKWLDEAYATHDSGLTQLTITPFLFPYRDDQRFAVLCARSSASACHRRHHDEQKRSFFAELKRRNVIRMAGLYLVGAWLLVQVAGTVLPMFDAPDWLPRSIVILLAIGFIPALIFSWVFEVTPEGLKRDADVPPEQSIAPQTARRMDRTIIVVLVLALAYFAVDKFVLNQRREQPAATTSASESRPVPNEKSVAVLAFANLSDDKGSEYFSDGISEELLTVLQKIPGLHVAARTSAFSFKGKNATAQEIGQKLGVAHLVEGSVRKAGDVVRIAARLTQANTGEEIWSENYTRDLKDVFAVQTELAQTIVGQLRGQLSNGAEIRWPKRRFRRRCKRRKKGRRKMWRPTSIICRAAFMRIAARKKALPRPASNTRRRWNLTRVTRSPGLDWPIRTCGCATLATRLGGRASMLTLRARGKQPLGRSNSSPTCRRRCAFAHIFNSVLTSIGKEQTIRCRPPFVWPRQTLRSLSRPPTWQTQKATWRHAIDYRKAVADPVNPRARLYLAYHLAITRQFAEAQAESARLIELSPAAPWAHASLGLAFLLQGKFEEAAAAAHDDAAGWARLLSWPWLAGVRSGFRTQMRRSPL